MGKFLDKIGLATFWTKCKDTFVKKSGASTITGDMGTITFDPNGTGEHNVYECGIGIKIDDQTYAKIEPACIDLHYNGGMFSMSAEEGYISVSNNNYTNGADIWAGAIDITGPYGAIRMDTTDEGDENAYLKMSRKDDPDNANSYISATSIWINAYGNYFEVSPEDGYFALYNDHYSTYLNYGSIMLRGPDGDIIIDAANNSLSSGAHLGRMVGDNTYEYTLPNKSGTFALTDDIETAKTYQHDIYVMPGSSYTAGIYIYLTLNIRRSAKISSVADLCSILKSRGNDDQKEAVSATGRYGTSSSDFRGFVIGVWATSSDTLNIVYLTTSGAVSTASCSASMFTNNPYDIVN